MVNLIYENSTGIQNPDLNHSPIYYTIQIDIEWYILSIYSNDKTSSESTICRCLGPPSPTMPRLHYGFEDTVFFQGWLNVNLTWAFVFLYFLSRVDTPLIHHFNRVNELWIVSYLKISTKIKYSSKQKLIKTWIHKSHFSKKPRFKMISFRNQFYHVFLR